jgi:hypothetical protein
MLENSRVPIRVDAVSGTLLGESAGRAVEGAAHQFVIVRVKNGPAFLVDPTFGQFLTPGSSNVRQFQRDIATGFLDTPQGMRLAHDLVNKGYVPLSRENLALYTRALGYDVGPVGSIVPGPVAEHLRLGKPHYGIVQFDAQDGAIRQLDLPEPTPGAPATAAEIKAREAQAEARYWMFDRADHPSSIAEHARRLLDEAPVPATAQDRAARARVAAVLKDLEDLAKRYKGRVQAWDI